MEIISNTICFCYTYHCNIACDHCIVSASPKRFEKIDFEVAKSLIEDVIRLGFVSVIFTGGESLIFKKEIFALTKMARKTGMEVTIITNGFWALTFHEADLFASDIAKAGITHVAISSDKYHVKGGIPSEAVTNAFRALSKYGISVIVTSTIEKNVIEFDKFQKPAKYKLIHNYIIPCGRAAGLNKELLQSQSDAVDDICSNSSLMILSSLKVLRCCGPLAFYKQHNNNNPIVLGDLSKESLEEIIIKVRQGQNIFLEVFAAWGPKKLGLLLSKDFWREDEKPPFYSVCDLYCRLLNNSNRVTALRRLIETPDMRLKIRRYIKLMDMLAKEIKEEKDTVFTSPSLITGVNQTI